MMGPMTPPAAIKPAEVAKGYPFFRIIGNTMVAKAAASANAEPDMADNMMAAAIAT